MSSALVRQALELVDPEESVRGRSKKAKRPALGQGHGHPYKNKNKSQKAEKSEKSAEKVTEENIRKLLVLSKPTADPSITRKIVKRATGRKPLADKPAKKKEANKSILFPEDEDAGKSILLPDEDDDKSILRQDDQDAS